MPSYTELNALPAEAYLDANNFWSDFEGRAGRIDPDSRDYQRGLAQGRKSTEVGICANGTWYARGKDSSSTTSYEGIGYHAGTANFWAGVLDSGCAVYVHRDGRKVCIKEARGYWLYDPQGLWGRGSDLDDLIGRAKAAGIVDYVVCSREGDKGPFTDVAGGGNGLHFEMI